MSVLTVNITTSTDTAVSKFIERGIDALTAKERLLVSIWGLEADVNNGGFDQYYFNRYGDFATEVVGHLERIGALHAAAIVREANSVFGLAGPSVDRDDRQKAAEVVSEQASEVWESLGQKFCAYPDDIQGLLDKYVGDGDGPV